MYKEKDVIGLFLPANTLAEMRTVDNEIKLLQEEINTSSIKETFGPVFDRFVDEWVKFYSENKDSTVRLALNSTWDKVKEYKDRLNTWRARYKRSGHTTLTTELGPKPIKVPVWGWFVVGGVGVYGLIKYMGAKTRLVSATSGLVRAKSGRPKSHKKGQY